MEAPDDTRHSILLVDDETNFSWSIARALDVKGFRVATAASVEEALAHLRTEPVELVLTDIKMPGMDGFELVEWLRVHRPETAVMMATAFGSLSMRDKALQLGAISYIEKPIDLNALMAFLQNLFYSPGFVGRIRDIDLLDYLQLVSNTHKTKIVQLSNRLAVGRLVFENGQLVHAQQGSLEGLPAFYEIVSWSGGALTDIPFEAPLSRTVTENTAFLLMEAARMRDEREHRTQGQPTTSAPPRPAALETRVSSARPGVFDERAGGGPFGRFRRFIEGLESFHTLKGAVLVSREGLILARGGGFPSGIEPLVMQLSKASDSVGEGLELGPHEAVQMNLEDGATLQVQPAGDYLVAVWLNSAREAREVAAWVRGRSIILQ